MNERTLTQINVSQVKNHRYSKTSSTLSRRNPLCFNTGRLMTRDQFIPATQLNLLAVGWIQFTVHDWFDHGPVDTSSRIKVDLDTDDPVYQTHKGKMNIPRTKPDNCQKYSVTISYFIYRSTTGEDILSGCINYPYYAARLYTSYTTYTLYYV